MPELLTRKNFKCDRYCGECCKKMIVRVSKKDIERIKKLGYKEEDFVVQDIFNPNRKNLQKKKNGWCIFLKKDNNRKYWCSIHKSRPKICRDYPFFGKNPEPIKSCLPQDLYPNVFFSFSAKNKQ